MVHLLRECHPRAHTHTLTDSSHTRHLRCMLLMGHDRSGKSSTHQTEAKNILRNLDSPKQALQKHSADCVTALHGSQPSLFYCILNGLQPLHRPALVGKSSVTMGGSTPRHTMLAIFFPSLISILHRISQMTAATCSAIPGRSSERHENLILDLCKCLFF